MSKPNQQQKPPQGAPQGQEGPKAGQDSANATTPGPEGLQKPPEVNQPPAPIPENVPAVLAVPPSLYSAGWRPIPQEGMPKVFYGIRGGGSETEAVRVEFLDSGNVQVLALPGNMKSISVERINDLLLTEQN
jgi:hypothetical protein